jgi:lipopolysaccharide biosynthesis protein
MDPRVIAFYLPQFHPIPENDAWWGKGFTDWTNVAKAKPAFKGHYQPHLPADLGFYDLRVPEARQAQADLAREYGIHGFCYYHYWFKGRRLLERPFNEVLNSSKPDFPFCLCWANESWTRLWDGQEQEVLMAQNYNEEDDLNHIRWLAGAFRDPRYIRVHGRPLFLVYRLSRLPDPERTVEIWRNEARRLGVGDIFICNVESFGAEHGLAPQYNLDGAVEFAPDHKEIPPRQEANKLTYKLSRWPRIQRVATVLELAQPWFCTHEVYSYAELMNNMLVKPNPPYLRFPCVTPAWDNAARRQFGAAIYHGSTPDLYEQWLAAAVQKAKAVHANEPIVFINAWNEWAEGNHLEPCQKWGHAYLQATRNALKNGNTVASAQNKG